MFNKKFVVIAFPNNENSLPEIHQVHAVNTIAANEKVIKMIPAEKAHQYTFEVLNEDMYMAKLKELLIQDLTSETTSISDMKLAFVGAERIHQYNTDPLMEHLETLDEGELENLIINIFEESINQLNVYANAVTEDNILTPEFYTVANWHLSDAIKNLPRSISPGSTFNTTDAKIYIIIEYFCHLKTLGYFLPKEVPVHTMYDDYIDLISSQEASIEETA